ncbi:transporter substrate-binding domain-containing protein [Leucobacter muris]|uniref:Transporter substrate-binding domain-containing protein n=1 Tax=Leucobacter muris TaxID=1935379 RepID=A0ABX5QIP0_9MICO|nr:transporter substrate-binding domain-containing protein [Leucobacter muris]QAB18890.1 transporter substrate-binding domain-containing protein [Leucobacter muris]
MLHRTRTAAALAALAAGALLLTACSGGDSGSAGAEAPAVASSTDFPEGSTMARLAEAGTVTIGTKFDQPLFGLKGLDNQPTGFDVEIGKIIAGELGIPADKIDFIETNTKVRDEAVMSGKADMVIATYMITEERQERVTFAGTYYNAGTLTMALADNDAITGIESVGDPSVKVCGATGSADLDAISEHLADPDAQLVLFDVYSKCADALRTGQVDAIAADSTILLGLADEADGEFKIVGESYLDQLFGIGITKGDVEFCEFIDDTLNAAVEDGRFAEAWKRTAGTVVPEVPSLPEFIPCA